MEFSIEGWIDRERVFTKLERVRNVWEVRRKDGDFP